MQDVVVVIGAGQIGQAIARRAGIGKQVLLAAAAEELPPNVIRFLVRVLPEPLPRRKSMY